MRNREAYVFVHLNGEFVPAGLLTFLSAGHDSKSLFSYGLRYMQRPDAFALDPERLPLMKGAIETRANEVLFGAFCDASPDAWGKHVLDTAAMEMGRTLSEFDYLYYAGGDRIGALGFGPAVNRPPFVQRPPWPVSGEGELDMGQMIKAAETIDNEENLPPRYRQFFVRGSSIGGAHPKAVVSLDGADWIAKFDRRYEAWPTCRIECAAMRLAADCGVTAPEVQLVGLLDRTILLIRRFDRQDSHRIPFLSAATLTGVPHQTLDMGGSYQNIVRAMRRHSVSSFLNDDMHELFRRVIFNVFIHNSDDHLRNHGFLYRQGGWCLSPAYDVVPQPQDDGPSRLMLEIGKYGTECSVRNVLSAAAVFGISQDEAQSIVETMRTAFEQNFMDEFTAAGVPERVYMDIFREFQRVTAGIRLEESVSDISRPRFS